MNERIRELAEQADPENWHSRWYSGINPRVMDPEIKKFAELIVQECAKFLEENSGYDDCNNAWYPEPEDLLKHFGIK